MVSLGSFSEIGKFEGRLQCRGVMKGLDDVVSFGSFSETGNFEGRLQCRGVMKGFDDVVSFGQVALKLFVIYPREEAWWAVHV